MHHRSKAKTDRELCTDFLRGDTDAFHRITHRYSRQIERIAEQRFRRTDMSDDLMAAVCHALSARGYMVLLEWYDLASDSIETVIEKLGVESPLLD